MPSVLDEVLSCPSLPSLPTVAIQILDLTRNPNTTIAQIAKVVQGDPALTAKVLRTVNSSLYGLPQKVTKLDRAMGLLGLSVVKSIVLGFSLVDSTKGIDNAKGFDIESYWTRTIYAAAGARQIAKITRAADPDEAFTAAMFQDIGMLAAYSALGNRYASAVSAVIDDTKRLLEAEKQAFEIDHQQIGGAIARKWNMPAIFVSSIEHHHAPDSADASMRDMVRTVALGALVAETLISEQPAQAMATLLIRANDWFGDRTGDLEQLLEKVAAGAEELAAAFEKDVGARPDIRALMTTATELSLEVQLATFREKDELAHVAITDGLTGAANRKHFDSRLATLFNEANASGKPLGALFIDADKFKSVNDTHGHAAGDAVLIELARRMATTVGESGTLFRYGGEEFAILLPGADFAAVQTVAESIRAAIAATPFDLAAVKGAPPTIKVTVSVGASSHDRASRQIHASGEALVHAADQGVYAAKQGGRNCVRAMSAADHAPAVKAPVAPLSQPTIPGSCTRVLLIEDDPLAARLFQAALQKAGCVVTWVHTGDEAMKAVCPTSSSPSHHFIICDYQIGKTNAADIFRHGRAHGLVTPFIVCSCLDETEVKHACVEAGVTEYISKFEICRDMTRWVTHLLSYAGNARVAA